MKVAIVCADCILDITMLDNMLKHFKKNGIERTCTLKDADYLLLITCRGTGKSITEFTDYLCKSIDLIKYEKKNLKLIVTG